MYNQTAPQLKSPFDEHLQGTHPLPTGEIYPRNSSPDVFLINFPIMLFPRSSPSSPQINGQSHIWLFLLPNKMLWPCALPEVLPRCEDFPLLVTFRVILERGLCGDCIMGRTISKPGPSLLSPSQPIIRNTPWGYGCMLGSRWHSNWSRNHRHQGNFFMWLACAFRTCLGPITYL